ncbi:MAG TPA: L-rhamnose mutarotase [Bacteroidales bacterium]|nr:L-rhamnose mutarotase [Bacteroidales bacterium]
METKENGYPVKIYTQPVKRYCQTLDLKDDPALISEYVLRHSKAKAWPEIINGIREVGILEMEIFILGTRLFMIVETPLDFEWETAMTKLAGLPRQAEWEDYMSIFQMSKPGASSAEKWQLMDKIFNLYD